MIYDTIVCMPPLAFYLKQVPFICSLSEKKIKNIYLIDIILIRSFWQQSKKASTMLHEEVGAFPGRTHVCPS